MTFAEIESFSENTATFKATVDVRLRWQDLRLRRPAAEAADPPRVFRGAEAQAQLATLWVPNVEVTNQRGNPSYTTLGLRIYPDGQVELTRRTTAEFATPHDVERFPFDRQKLQIELAIRDQTADVVALGFDQRDLDSSRAAAGAHLEGWTLLHTTLRSEPLAGWYGATHAHVVASLEIARHPAAPATAIGIPLFATLLIPFLAIWLNRVKDGQLQLEAHSLINLLIGGLFAVIALNLSVNSRYTGIERGRQPGQPAARAQLRHARDQLPDQSAAGPVPRGRAAARTLHAGAVLSGPALGVPGAGSDHGGRHDPVRGRVIFAGSLRR